MHSLTPAHLSLSNLRDIRTDLTVAVASELGDEAHVILADLNHLLTDVVLRAAGYGRARPPAWLETDKRS